MKKKNKIIIGFCVSCLVIISVFSVQNIRKINADSLYSERADLIKEGNTLNKTKNNSEIIIQGDNFAITENEITTKTKIYKAKGEQNPEEAAVKHLIKRQVLLNKALEEGYTITEEEVDNEITLVKEAIKTTENYSDWENFINEYGGEDAYWEDIRDTYRNSLIINKYLDSEKEKYYKENNDFSDSENVLSGWNKKQEEIVSNLIKEQKVNIVSTKYNDIALE